MSGANGETVLVTGASSGIGRELARCFAADGSRLVLTARNTGELQALADELNRAHKTEVTIISADLSLSGTPHNILTELQGRGITVDVLVNNAGFGAWGSFAELPLARQLEMLQVNITALTELTGLFLPGMLQRRRGGIMNVASVAGFLPGPGMAVYYATKAFVLSFSEALAEELAGTNVTVTALCPGPTATNFGQVARADRTRMVRTARMSAEAVARHGLDSFRKRRVVTVPGLQNRLLVQLIRAVPRSWVRKLAARFNGLRERQVPPG
ncbi:MAG TPA: SDR family oxidoreductase [Candidatus Acidoferrales bacterium]|nr:SDR family oxidoreductase [Candidatus Acidoferrales bacterium]